MSQNVNPPERPMLNERVVTKQSEVTDVLPLDLDAARQAVAHVVAAEKASEVGAGFCPSCHDLRSELSAVKQDRDAGWEAAGIRTVERDRYLLECGRLRECLQRVVTHASCDHDGMTYQELADMAAKALVQP